MAPGSRPRIQGRRRTRARASLSRVGRLAFTAATCAAVVLGGCGSSQQARAGGSSVGAPLTLRQVEFNLKAAGYRITVYTPHEGVLQIDATHKASGGLSID